MELKQSKKNKRWKCGRVLIVPYGIETSDAITSFYSCLVLIVPYGIETE